MIVAVVALGLSSCGQGRGVETGAALSRLAGDRPQLTPPEAVPPVTTEGVESVAGLVDVDDLLDLSTTTTVATTTPSPTTTGTPLAAAPATPALPPLRPVPGGAEVYSGLGTWIDVFDWSRTFGKDGPLVEVADIDRMADLGVQTLYVQTSRFNVSADILEPERLVPLIERARARGMGVVAWYLPTFVDPEADLARLLAAATLDVDSVAVDIESRDLADSAERNRRLVTLSREVRQALPGMALGAIVFPPVVMEVINTSFWPGFPWAEMAPSYDVWVPMAYQSYRSHASGYRDGYRYTAENIDRLRAHVGNDALVHTVGGIADVTTGADVDGMVAAAAERGAIGGSLYDWRTTAPELWDNLRAFRR